MTILMRRFPLFAAIICIAVSLTAAPLLAAEPGSDEEFEQVMALLTQRLSLSPYQVETVGPRVREHLDAMRDLFASYRYGGAGSLPSLMQEFEELREDFRVDMDVHLNDQQMAGLAELRDEVDASIRDTVIEHRVETLRDKLGLSAEQVAAVRPIVADAFDERQRLMWFHTDRAGSAPD